MIFSTKVIGGFLIADAAVCVLSTAMVLFADGIVIDGIYILAILGGAGTVIAFLFRLLISSKDRETALILAQKEKESKELESMKKSYAEIASEALKSAMETANYYRQREGKAPIIPLAPVISESHSPSTPEQRETANIQTMRAALAHIKLVEGQQPRVEPPKDTSPETPSSPPPPVVSPAEPINLAAVVRDIKDAVREVTSAELKSEIAAVPKKTAEAVIKKLDDRETV